MEFKFPSLPYSICNPKLKDLLNLKKIVVVVGFGEVGPWGSSRTRWDIESNGILSLESCIELAWMMNLIEFKNSNGSWVDVKSGKQIEEWRIKNIYEDEIVKELRNKVY